MTSDKHDPIAVPSPHYICPACDGELPPTEARIEVICSDDTPRQEPLECVVRDATGDDRRAIEAICDQAYGEVEIDLFGRTFDVFAGDNIVADVDGELAGLVSLAVHAGELAIVVFSVYPRYQGRHVGTRLLEAAVQRASEKGLHTVLAAVSNDDVPMLYFFQRNGFAIREVAVGALIDRIGFAGTGFANIPMRDEIRLRRPVGQ